MPVSYRINETVPSSVMPRAVYTARAADRREWVVRPEPLATSVLLNI